MSAQGAKVEYTSGIRMEVKGGGGPLILLSQKVAADGEENLEGYVRSGGTGSGASGWSATSHKPD